MAKAKVVHSADGCTILMEGNPSSPEPSTSVIKFPYGHVEVSRTSDNQYWAHIHVNQSNMDGRSKTGKINGSRITYTLEAARKNKGDIPNIPADTDIQTIAIMLGGDNG